MTKSRALIFVCFTHPSTATIPSLASMPTAIFPGCFLQALITKSGFFKAIVPRITLSIPVDIHKSIVSRFLMPPPSCIFIFTFFIIFSTAFWFIGFPSKAPFKSTKCNQEHPDFKNEEALDTGSESKIVALFISPFSNLTH